MCVGFAQTVKANQSTYFLAFELYRSKPNVRDTEDTTIENDLAANFADKLILDMEDPDVVDPAIKESYEGLPALQ